MRYAVTTSIRFMLLLSLVALVFQRAEGVSRVLPEKQQELDQIRAIYNQGLSLHRALQTNPGNHTLRDQKRATFREAAEKLSNWIKIYAPDKNSLTYLKNTCRLGVYWEQAGDFTKAKEAYRKCTRHPELLNPSATYKDKPIALRVTDRLKMLESNQNSLLERNIEEGGLQGVKGRSALGVAGKAIISIGKATSKIGKIFGEKHSEPKSAYIVDDENDDDDTNP